MPPGQFVQEETREFAFDMTLQCALRVKASSIEEARRIIRASINCVEANLGIWPSGSPILAEVSVNGAMDVFEVDGEPVVDEDEDDSHPPRCSNATGHEWPNVEESERSLCVHCGADGDA